MQDQANFQHEAKILYYFPYHTSTLTKDFHYPSLIENL
jgi:hypothetical protein